MKFTVSLGNSRKDKVWKKYKFSWDEFTKKLSKATVTSETQAEYRKMKRHKQDAIKDVGGFVAGELKDGRRRKENVQNRTMITLDMDYGDDADSVAEDVEILHGYTCCIYSTHKHTPKKPRLRLIIPLSRKVSPDEYQAVSRMVAKQIGIELFDDTTYEPNRLMYWPSTSSDGKYYFKVIKGELLNPDDILNIYKNWKDSSTWPVSSRQETVINRLVKKQQDPLKKDGLVGAFCRSYTICEAIEKFIPKTYKQSAMPDRYDYALADSTAGVVNYDDKYAYSHHATDPACGKLLNAFDLVRIHRFGEVDEGAVEDKQLPSYKAMLDFCTEDKKVKRQLAKERQKDLKDEFEQAAEAPHNTHKEDDDVEWQLSLELNKNGTVKDTPTNILTILRKDPKLQAIAYNEMTHSLDVNGKLPWEQLKPGWNDADLANLKMYFDKQFNIWSPTKIKDALLSAASERAFHPIRNYLERLPKWDKRERLDTLLIEYLGADDNNYTRAVMRKTLCAAVARVYEPGTKFDYILVLNGPQGIGKSTFFAKLGDRWFSDSLTVSDMRDKAAAEKLQGYWILELGELAGLKKMDVETVKSFITRTDDKFRHSYGVNVENHPRQCVIVGSTNNTSGFLRDVTGNRRFWPVRVRGGKKKVWDINEVDQIWAEALYKYKGGEELYLKGDVESVALEEQRDAMEGDDREGLVKKYLETLLPDNWKSMDLYERRSYLAGESDFGESNLVGTVARKRVCPLEIWCECFGKDRTSIKRTESYEIEAILMKIGNWKRYEGNKKGNMKFSLYGSQRAFVKVGKEDLDETEEN
ncbi:virulence-associated E family protein [Proteinivorax tanatarense]|uniref:Virulence-associated E family protein n=1 Tax=Proteinivorax tanatarense TaxID=1260629 RepID=A0AAU7VI05_9FIRM